MFQILTSPRTVLDMSKFATILATVFALLALCNAEFQLKEKWPTDQGEFFKGIVIVPIETRVMNGWNMQLKFDKSVRAITVYEANIQSSSSNGKRWTFVNKDWNRHLSAGQDLFVSFIATLIQRGMISNVEVYFNGQRILEPGQVPPPAPTTMAPTHAPTTTTTTMAPTHAPTAPPFVPGATLEWNNRWPGHFEATVRIPINENVIGGWTLSLSFDVDVYSIQIWNVRLVKTWSSNRGFDFVNMDWNRDLYASTVLEISFIGVLGNADIQPQEIGVMFNGKLLLIGGDFNPPKPATTAQPNPPTTTATATGNYNYTEVLEKSILFYEAQRSGELPPNNRIAWRGDSAVNDGSDVGHDLSGGWYGDGPHVKFNFPMAWSTTVLLWGLLDYKDAYQRSGQYHHMLDSVKWPLDYFIKCHTADNELYGQVGQAHANHSYWGSPETMTMNRPSFKIDASRPGSDLAAETAAAMAAGSLVFRTVNATYASILLTHARMLFLFADQHRGIYSHSIPDVYGYYSSNRYTDELCWAAAWLHMATGEASYLTYAEDIYGRELTPLGVPWAFSWSEKTPGCQILLARITGKASYLIDTATFMESWVPGGSVKHTPKGLAWRDRIGSLRYAANTALIFLQAADLRITPDSSRAWAKKQIDYMLGDTGRSFVVGFGSNPPQKPRHRASSCNIGSSCNINSAGPNVHVLYGALVGGPDDNDVYVDDRVDYFANEVDCDYNAGFQSTVAGLLHLAYRGH